MQYSFKQLKSEISEIYYSIQSSIVDRVASPFAWSFIIAWSLHNWRLLYGLIYFDEGCNLECRYGLISAYINDAGWHKLLLQPLKWSLIGIVFFLVFNALYAGLFIFYKRWILPAIHLLIDKSAFIVTKEEYLRVVMLAETQEKLINKISTELNGIRNLYSQLKTQSDQSAVQFSENKALLDKLTDENSKYKSENIIPYSNYHEVVQGKWDMQAIYPEQQSLHSGIEIKNESTNSNPSGKYVSLVIQNVKNPYAGERWICMPITRNHIIVFGIQENSTDQYKSEMRLFFLTRSSKNLDIDMEEL